MSVVRRLASQVAAGRAVDFRPSLTWRGTALSSALFALALAAADAPSQSGGCAQCASVPVAPEAAAPQRTAEPRRMKRVALRFDLRSERPKRGAFGGSYAVCVRACDGSFFPVLFRRESVGRAGDLPIALPQRDGRALFASVRRHDRRGRCPASAPLRRMCNRSDHHCAQSEHKREDRPERESECDKVEANKTAFLRFAISEIESVHDGFGARVCAPESNKKAANESDTERGGSV
jgi:hypothetical protein